MTPVTAKVCLVGDFAVGKTSTVSRFVNNVFSEKYLTTVGVKIDTKEVVLHEPDKIVKLVLWDIAGKDRFSEIDLSYLSGSAGYLLIADGTRRATVDSAFFLREQIEVTHGTLPYVFLVNKHDLTDQWEVAESELATLRRNDVPTYVTSAKTGSNVEVAFEKLAAMIFERVFAGE